MGVKPVPRDYRTVTPYLITRGVPRLIGFLKAAFHAEEVERTMGEDGRVMHAAVKIGDSMVMMGEGNEQQQVQAATLYVYVHDVDAVYRSAVEAGGVSFREPADQFYGDRVGGVRDPSGNAWWIATHIEDVSQEELAHRMSELARQKK